MKIMCKQSYYDEAIRYAHSINDTTLDACLEKLKSWENNPRCPCEIELHYDFAPYSFKFVQRYPDGSVGIVGGLLYHGKPDCSLQSFTNRFMAGVLIPERYISITDSQVAIKDDDITILDVTVRRRTKSFGPPTHSQNSSTNFFASGYFL